MKWLWKYLENEPTEPIPAIGWMLFWLCFGLINTHLWRFFYFGDIFIGIRFLPLDYIVLFFYFAFWEELEYRAILFFMIMLSYRRKYITKRTAKILIFIFIVCVSFLFFGLEHYPHKWTNLAIQGVFGIILAIFYLKFGGMEAKFFKPLFYATLLHALYNFCVYCVIVLKNPHF